ncbi:hypothetical protein [Dokdonia sp.]|uniref:hypothetical protein n=1 Tax=Dokdonia sp. TaxID=2024995 RepID=UPI00326461D2
MKINIVTNNFKKTTRFLNISLLIFCLFMLISLISFWFTNNEIMEAVFVIFLFAGGAMLLISILLLILRQTFKEAIEVNVSQIETLHINSQIDVSQIKERAEIAYFGNSLKIIHSQKDYELNNKTAFKLLKDNDTIITINTSIKIKELDIPPKEVFKAVMGTLFGWH